jgi:hypothetical protein
MHYLINIWIPSGNIPVESDKARKKSINEIADGVKFHNDIWPDMI